MIRDKQRYLCKQWTTLRLRTQTFLSTQWKKIIDNKDDRPIINPFYDIINSKKTDYKVGLLRYRITRWRLSSLIPSRVFPPFHLLKVILQNYKPNFFLHLCGFHKPLHTLRLILLIKSESVDRKY